MSASPFICRVLSCFVVLIYALFPLRAERCAATHGGYGFAQHFVVQLRSLMVAVVIHGPVRAYAEAADGSDQTRAQQTADALLAELSEIEASLAEQQKIRRADPSAERGV